MALRLPRRLGSYLLIERIARGGMATVYLARREAAPEAEPLRVIKCLHAHLLEQSDQRCRFQREAKVLAMLDHPNVVTCLDSGEGFIVMERLEGSSLAQVITASATGGAPSLPPGILARAIAGFAKGLHAIHQLRHSSGEPWDLVHGDVSPQNLFVSASGEVKVLDLGLVRSAREGSALERADLSGRLAYLSPERLLGLSVDRRADVFALGAVLWEAMTRRRLFRRDSDEETRALIINHRVPAPSRFDPKVPRRLESIVIRALRLDPSGRYQSAAEFAADLERFADSFSHGVREGALSSWVLRRLPELREIVADGRETI